MADDLALAPVARTDVVQTSNGPVRGNVEDGLAVFKGLRYGASPEGLQRFKPPQRPAPWSDPAVRSQASVPERTASSRRRRLTAAKIGS